MSAVFTPGPWTVRDRTCVKNAGEPHRFTCGLTRTAYASREEMEANARLIAAAPDLYEALEALLNVIEANLGKPTDCYLALSNHRLRDKTHAALAKARGEA